ncbi:UDP-glycosyltransferase 87A2-like [Primulina huaijiensis]|uniref:UDP-glycosyltransferase 87A2-like n=1 Tax=Primulina huaijiensis TaxID=1492673 RepID=UPI003CC6FD90
MDCGIVDCIPGLAPSRVADLPSIIRDQEMASAFLKVQPQESKAKYLIFTAIYHLESQAFDAFEQKFLPRFAAQMDDIVTGLNKRGVPFLLVMQNETNYRLQEICGDNGLFVEWCDQVSVLCHPRVGWFWSHCGWNSTKEAVLAAVLLLAFPIVMDQLLNANMIIEDWRIGWRVKRDEYGDDDCLAKRDDIADLVWRFMEMESPERKELRSVGKF